MNSDAIPDRLKSTPGGIRTHGLPLRRRPLYPTELRVHALILNGFAILSSNRDLGFVRNCPHHSRQPSFHLRVKIIAQNGGLSNAHFGNRTREAISVSLIWCSVVNRLGGVRSIRLSYRCLYFKALTAFGRPPFHPCNIPFSLSIVNVRFCSGAGFHRTGRRAIFPVPAARIRGTICGFLLLSMGREGMTMRALIYSSSMSSVIRRCSFFFPVSILMCGMDRMIFCAVRMFTCRRSAT